MAVKVWPFYHARITNYKAGVPLSNDHGNLPDTGIILRLYNTPLSRGRDIVILENRFCDIAHRQVTYCPSSPCVSRGNKARCDKVTAIFAHMSRYTNYIVNITVLIN